MTFSRNAAGHLAALLTILIWGTTFISTKVLLRSFSPVEILFIRFTIGYLSLLAFSRNSCRSGISGTNCTAPEPASAASRSISWWKTSP